MDGHCFAGEEGIIFFNTKEFFVICSEYWGWFEAFSSDWATSLCWCVEVLRRGGGGGRRDTKIFDLLEEFREVGIISEVTTPRQISTTFLISILLARFLLFCCCTTRPDAAGRVLSRSPFKSLYSTLGYMTSTLSVVHTFMRRRVFLCLHFWEASSGRAHTSYCLFVYFSDK